MTTSSLTDVEDPSVTTRLFPQPRSFALLEEEAPAFDAPLTVEQDGRLHAQGYRLRYAASGIRLVFADAAGLRYGQQALDQLRGTPTEEQEAVAIEDWPDFERRGFMLDVSRDRVPTRASLARLVDVLVVARINQLELYLENTFAYSGHEVAWQDASPLTREDVRWLDDLCAARGIELVPNQNTFGHWERWLEHDEYLPRAENRTGMDFAGTFLPPSTLAPTQNNATFVTGLLEELTVNFRSRRLNIGADETWELGTGVSKEQAETEGLGVVYLDYVSLIMAPWVERGFTVQFWADILANHPSVAHQVPKGTVPVVWQYDSPSLIKAVAAAMTEEERQHLLAHGTDIDTHLDGFVDRARTLIDAEIPFWVAPGTSSWLSILGRLDNAIENMVDAAEVGLAHGSTGFLITAWGDSGMYDPPVIAYPPLLYGGAISWSLEANHDIDLAAVLSGHVFDDESGVLGQVLVDIGGVTKQLGVPVFNASPLFLALLRAGELKEHQYPSDVALAAVRDTLHLALDQLAVSAPASADSASVLAELEQAIGLALFAVDFLREGLQQPGADNGDATPARHLLRRLDALLAQQHKVWLLSSRPGGLARSISQLLPLRRALVARAES